ARSSGGFTYSLRPGSPGAVTQTVSLTSPAGLAQAVEHMLVILGAVPRNAFADVHLKRTAATDGHCFVERDARLVQASNLAERRGERAIYQRKVRMKAHHPSRGVDCRLVVAGKIMGDSHAVEVPRKERVARVQPDAGLESDEPLPRFATEDQSCSQRAVRAR